MNAPWFRSCTVSWRTLGMMNLSTSTYQIKTSYRKRMRKRNTWSKIEWWIWEPHPYEDTRSSWNNIYRATWNNLRDRIYHNMNSCGHRHAIIRMKIHSIFIVSCVVLAIILLIFQVANNLRLHPKSWTVMKTARFSCWDRSPCKHKNKIWNHTKQKDMKLWEDNLRYWLVPVV